MWRYLSYCVTNWCVCVYICCNIVSNTIISLGILNIGGWSLILLRSRYNNTTLGSNGLGCSQHVLMVQGVLLIAGELLELCIKNSMMKYSFSYISRGEHTVLWDDVNFTEIWVKQKRTRKTCQLSGGGWLWFFFLALVLIFIIFRRGGWDINYTLFFKWRN